MRALDIKHLQYFIQVTHFKSFTKAAEHLFITQPTISKMIKILKSNSVSNFLTAHANN